jgi:hypothetical protein
MSGSSTWFVKHDGKIRGPFNLTQLRSMKDRGRLLADSEVSQDRVSWVFAVSIAELFGEIISVAPGAQINAAQPAVIGQMPAAPPALGPPALGPPAPTPPTGMMPAPPPPASVPMVGGSPQGLVDPSIAASPQPEPEPDPECYYQVDGIRQGPVRLSGVRDLITVGTLQANDFVWIEGSPTWVQVQDIPQLAVPNQIARAKHRFVASPILITCVGMIAVMLVALPTWFILSRDKHVQSLEEEAAMYAEKQRLEFREDLHRGQDIAIDERRHDREIATLNRENRRFDEEDALEEAKVAAIDKQRLQQAQDEAAMRRLIGGGASTYSVGQRVHGPEVSWLGLSSGYSWEGVVIDAKGPKYTIKIHKGNDIYRVGLTYSFVESEIYGSN